MKLYPHYIYDNDKAQEAFTSYQKILGGTLEIARYKDLGVEIPADRKEANPIANIRLSSDQIMLMGSDNLRDPVGHIGNMLSHYVILPTTSEIHRVVEEFLAIGARIIVPFFTHPVLQGFAAVRDIYGVLWSFTHQAGIRHSLPMFSPKPSEARRITNYYSKALSIEPVILNIGEESSSDGKRKYPIIMASFVVENFPQLIISDIIPGKEERIMGNAGAVAMVLEELNQGKIISSALAQNGLVASNMVTVPWAKGFSDFTDQFGLNWVINAHMLSPNI